MKGCCLAWAAVLAACCPCLLRAAENPAKRPARVVELERFPAYRWLLPNGESITLGGSMATIVYSDDPRAVELERRHHAEMKELIAQRKYKLHRSFGQEKWGGKRYEYWFTFADGMRVLRDFEIPLKGIKSWDDYLAKRQADETRRYGLINRAISAGRYRLKHVETRYSFVCRDAGTFDKYRVQFAVRRDGTQVARISPVGEEGSETPPLLEMDANETSWEEHLRAVRSGEREVMSDEVKQVYFYEIDLEDRTRTYLPMTKPLG